MDCLIKLLSKLVYLTRVSNKDSGLTYGSWEITYY